MIGRTKLNDVYTLGSIKRFDFPSIAIRVVRTFSSYGAVVPNSTQGNNRFCKFVTVTNH